MGRLVSCLITLAVCFTLEPVVRQDCYAASIPLPGGTKLEEVDFERHVMAVVGRMGCNGGACHGSFQGRGGFRLSLFSFDFDMDHEAIFDRVDIEDADASYLLEKATLETEHGGGKRFETGSWQHRVFREWIAKGASRTPGSGKVVSLKAVPETVRFRNPGTSSQLKVMATFADGTTENVTPFCDFRVKDDYVAELGEGGLIRSRFPGDTSIAISYLGHIRAARVLVPAQVERSFIYPKYEITNYVDRAVDSRLRLLNTVPSEVASDEEFLRRLTIDTIGSVPSPDELRSFLADTNPQKRSKKIDELLNDPLHAALWATRLSDITGNDTATLEQPREKRSRMWHDWLRVRLERNAGWDEIVRGILTATSRGDTDPQEWVRAETELETVARTTFETNYSERDTLDLYWSRRNVGLEQLSEQTAAAFLGVRLQCCRCHKHPYDQWTQSDYRAFANVFGQVQFGTSPTAKPAIDAENQRRQGMPRNQRLAQLREVFLNVSNPRRLNDPKTNQPLPPKLPGGPELDSAGDNRAGLVEWMLDSQNPFFARAFVNRVWEHYFGRGIVHPVDDFSVGNPPSNEELLDLLADDFVRRGYDIRHIENVILNSRTWQSSAIPNETNIHDRSNFSRSYPRRMIAPVVVDVLNAALGVEQQFTADAAEGERAIQVASTQVRDGNLRNTFRIFGRSDRKSACDCDGSVDPSLSQTLYMMTDDVVMRRIRNGRLRALLSTGDRMQRLQAGTIDHDELGAVLDEISLAMFSRYPTPAERRRSIEHVVRRDDGFEAMVDVVWAMVNSREFILNH